jgi:hypothetical protein
VAETELTCASIELNPSSNCAKAGSPCSRSWRDGPVETLRLVLRAVSASSTVRKPDDAEGAAVAAAIESSLFAATEAAGAARVMVTMRMRKARGRPLPPVALLATDRDGSGSSPWNASRTPTPPTPPSSTRVGNASGNNNGNAACSACDMAIERAQADCNGRTRTQTE